MSLRGCGRARWVRLSRKTDDRWVPEIQDSCIDWSKSRQALIHSSGNLYPSRTDSEVKHASRLTLDALVYPLSAKMQSTSDYRQSDVIQKWSPKAADMRTLWEILRRATDLERVACLAPHFIDLVRFLELFSIHHKFFFVWTQFRKWQNELEMQ